MCSAADTGVGKLFIAVDADDFGIRIENNCFRMIFLYWSFSVGRCELVDVKSGFAKGPRNRLDDAEECSVRCGRSTF